MKEKEFLKKLKDKKNVSFWVDVSKLISETKMLDIPRKENLLKRFFVRKTKNKSAEQIITEHFEEIVQKLNLVAKNGGCMPFFEQLLKTETTQHIVMEKFEFVLDEINARDITDAITFYQLLGNETFAENVDTVLQHITEPRKLFELSRRLKGENDQIDNKLNSALEKDKEGFAKCLLNKAISEGPRREVFSDFLDVEEKHQRLDNFEKDELLDKYSSKVWKLIDKSLQKEQKRMIDINQIGEGRYCEVYQIGDKILKLGPPRENENDLIDHPRILKPLLKTNLVNDNSVPFECVEVTQYAQKVSPEECQEQDLYEVYKDLRKDGIIWTDVKVSNLGKIDRKLVVIDLDYLYHKEDQNIIWAEECAQDFEKRFLQEEAEKIAQKFGQAQSQNIENLQGKKEIGNRGE